MKLVLEILLNFNCFIRVSGTRLINYIVWQPISDPVINYLHYHSFVVETLPAFSFPWWTKIVPRIIYLQTLVKFSEQIPLFQFDCNIICYIIWGHLCGTRVVNVPI